MDSDKTKTLGSIDNTFGATWSERGLEIDDLGHRIEDDEWHQTTPEGTKYLTSGGDDNTFTIALKDDWSLVFITNIGDIEATNGPAMWHLLDKTKATINGLIEKGKFSLSRSTH